MRRTTTTSRTARARAAGWRAPRPTRRSRAKYPTDDEAQIFYALYLAGTQTQADQTYAAYLKAAAILEKQFAKYPDHPGVAHYLIHSYDAPPIASKGLAAARRYAQIAPAAPHALHMPSHIFTRVGAWEESAATNRRSAHVAEGGNEPDEALPRDGLHGVRATSSSRATTMRGASIEEAMQGEGPQSGAVRRPLRARRDAGALRRRARRVARSDAAAADRDASFPFVEAITSSARALGAARSGDAGGRAEGRRGACGAAQRVARRRRTTYWATEVEVQRLSAAAWIALAQGRGAEALGLMRAAAGIEDKNEKNIVTPGRILPARELLGDMLLELKRPAEAFKEYEASQSREPNRYRGLYGAGVAASRSGNTAKAKEYFSRLVEMAGSGSPRTEIVNARAYLARN